MKHAAVSVLTLLLVNFSSAHAQISSDGTIRGTVRDAQGAVLPGATVTAASPTVPGVRTAISDVQGDYRLIDLPPGEYTIVAERSGVRRSLC